MWRRVRPLFLATVVIVPLYTYVVASWTYWDGAGGYGDRFFVEVFPLLAFALGSLYTVVTVSRPRRLLVGSAALVCCSAVTIQMVNYWQGHLSISGASFSQYLELLRFTASYPSGLAIIVVVVMVALIVLAQLALPLGHRARPWGVVRLAPLAPARQRHSTSIPSRERSRSGRQ
jgi:hypothetical protein